MEHRFPTSLDAYAAGYRRPNPAAGDVDISGTDPDGNQLIGYKFRAADGTESVTVSLTEARNQGGTTGAFTEMFPPPTPTD